MIQTRFRQALPYIVGIVVAGALYYSASRIEYTPRGDALGPDFWPKLAIGLMALVCVIEIVRAMRGAAEGQGLADLLEGAEEEQRTTHPYLLLGGVGVIIAYAVLLPVFGFLLGSLLFMAAFMYLGGYRKHVAIWSIAIGATFVIAFVFLRFAYVSLPRGEPPFDRFTDLIRIMVGG
jgi:putative tricarboxylic transport membrane protein